MNKLFKKLKKTFLQLLFHSCAWGFTFWATGILVAYVAGELKSAGVNMETFKIASKWGFWLMNAWNELDVDDYNYLKLKLSAALCLPSILMIIYYIKNYDKINNLELFKVKEEVYGSASWASEADIDRADLRAKKGMLLGVDKEGYYVADGFQHALLFAPTGSGKGVGFVIPNLLFWEDSVVVHDIKLENHQLTSGWRQKMGQQCFVWEPSNPDGVTHCYNPIDWVSKKPGQMVDDVQKISNLIMPEKDFWNNEARSLFVGVVLYLLADPTKPKSFGEVVRTMRSDDVIYNLAVVLDTLGDIIHPVGYMNLAAFLQKADKERSGVISTMNSSLELWANPLIDTATATSDFNVMEFKKKKTTIYVGLTPDNIQRLQKLMQVFYQQATEFLSRKMPGKDEPYGVMFLMDEFPTLGKMEQFKSGIAYFRGYRVRLFLIIQDTQQLKGAYEDSGMNSFLSNSTYRITFAANNYETANLISQLCGNKTMESASYSKPVLFDLNFASRTKSISKVQRALLLPQEVIQLPRDDQIVLIESFPPIRSKKIKYYEDKTFIKRLLDATFVPTQEPYDPRKSRNEEETNSENDEDDASESDEYQDDNVNDVDDLNENEGFAEEENINAYNDDETQGESEDEYAHEPEEELASEEYNESAEHDAEQKLQDLEVNQDDAPEKDFPANNLEENNEFEEDTLKQFDEVMENALDAQEAEEKTQDHNNFRNEPENDPAKTKKKRKDPKKAKPLDSEESEE